MAIGRPPEGELNPCDGLAGKKIKVEYVATPGTDYSGEIQTLGIYNDPEQP